MPHKRTSAIAHAIRTSSAVLLLALMIGAAAHAQEVPLEYQVKAVYLFNFVKFVRWPAPVKPAPITICVAERNPFGEALQEAIRGEVVEGRQVEARVIRAPDPACNVVFVPHDVAAKPYLDAARGSSTLLVGEKPDFLAQGGMVNFIIRNGSVRFEIDGGAAERADLRISSHLLRLARRG
ncbi:MAG: YfiR family protein [Vicinamibacterales bacterium]